VQAVVAAHGGTVTVRSVPGRTVFGVEIPATCQAPGGSAHVPAYEAAHRAGHEAAHAPPDEFAYDSQTGHRLSTQP
jgi:two-component system OmpR family sensor kinase